MPDYRIKLRAYLSAPDRSVWNAPLEHLACLNNLPLTRSDLTKLHGIASSSDRLNLPNNGQPSTIARHPISGQKHSVESTVNPIEIPLEIQTETDPEKVFWWFWRFYPDRLRQDTPDFLLHPAHSVLPDCPIHSYQSTVSALSGSVSALSGSTTEHPYLLLFSFSPIQDFIKASRKFLDFWAGSYLLHYLSAKLCWTIAEQYGPDAVITPSLWHQEIIDAFLIQKYPNFAAYFPETKYGKTPVQRWDNRDSTSLSTAGFPNAIVALVPGKEAATELGKKLTELIKEIWEDIGKQVHDDIRKQVGKYAADAIETESDWEATWKTIQDAIPTAHDPEPYQRDLQQWAHHEGLDDRTGNPHYTYPNWQWTALWNAQLKNTWEPYWTAVPLGKVGQPLAITKDEKDEFSSEWVTKQSAIAQPPEPIPSETEKSLYTTLNVGTYWGSLQQRLRVTLNAVKQTRNWSIPIAPGSRSTISGQFTALHPSLNYKKFPEGGGISEGSMQFFWWVMAQVYPGLFDGSEQLNALELTKRMAWNYGGVMKTLGIQDESAETLDYDDLIRFPNASSIAAARLACDHPEKVREYWNHLRKAFKKELEPSLNAVQAKRFAKTTRPFQIRNTDLAIDRLGRDSGFNGMMFSSKWLAEDLDLDLKQKAKLRTLVETAHKKSGFGDSSPSDWWVMLLADGDGMGDYVSGEKLKKYCCYINPDAIDYSNPAVNESQWQEFFQTTKKRMGPATHVGLNRALLDFSNRLVPYITEQRFCGKVVYSGGDDVMSVLPLEDLPEYLRSLRAAWRGDPDPQGEFITHPTSDHSKTGYWHMKPGKSLPGIPDRPLFTMGESATLSAGIIIAHKSVPLPTVLESLWKAESDRAKKMPGKDGFCFKVIYGNGNELEALMSGELLEQWWTCIENLTDDKIESLAPALYRLSEELPQRVSVFPDCPLIRKAAEVILDRREEQLQTRFDAVLAWIGDWETWAIKKQAGEANKPPIGTEIQDLSKLLRFTAFWVDKRVERLAWGKPADETQQQEAK